MVCAKMAMVASLMTPGSWPLQLGLLPLGIELNFSHNHLWQKVRLLTQELCSNALSTLLVVSCLNLPSGSKALITSSVFQVAINR